MSANVLRPIINKWKAQTNEVRPVGEHMGVSLSWCCM